MFIESQLPLHVRDPRHASIVAWNPKQETSLRSFLCRTRVEVRVDRATKDGTFADQHGERLV